MLIVEQRSNRTYVPVSEVVILCRNEEVREMVVYWIANSGVMASVAKDGHDAERILRNGCVRLLITDRMLPPWPGLGTFRDIKHRHQGLRVAVIEDSSREARVLGQRVGADMILETPLRHADVLSLMGLPD